MPEVIIDNHLVSYDKINNVPPWRKPKAAILFIHGVGADRFIWSEWTPRLANYYSVVRVDLTGHGKSDPWTGGDSLDYDFYLRTVSAVLDQEKFDKVILIGESMGGTICLYIASILINRVLAVATCSTAHRGGTLQHVQAWREFIEKNGWEAWSRDMLVKRFFPETGGTPILRWFDETQRNSDSESVLKMAKILVTSDLTNQLKRINVPVLLMQPDSSPFIPLDIPAELKNLLSKSRLKVIPFARHGIACSHAEDCSIETLAFLKENGLT